MKPSTQVRRQNREMDTDIKQIVSVLGYDWLSQIQKYTVNTQRVYLRIYDISEHILLDMQNSLIFYHENQPLNTDFRSVKLVHPY